MKLKTTIEELEKEVQKKYTYLKGICVFRKNNATYGRFYDPNKESGKGSYEQPYEWKSGHIFDGHYTVEDHSWNKERADKYVLKKYPHLKYCGQYLNNNRDAVMQYYDENIENDEKGSLNNPYTFQAKHLLDGQFTIGEKLWTQKRCDSYIHEYFPTFVFIKLEYIERKNKSKDGKNRRDSYAVYYDPNKKSEYGSIDDPYYFETKTFLKGYFSLKNKRLGEIICEDMIKTFTNNYVSDKCTMDGTQLRPDFTLYDYDTYVEVNGHQHYVPNGRDSKQEDSLETRKDRDNRKIKFAKEHNWNIIILPNPYDREVPSNEKIQVYLSNDKGLKVLENLKKNSYSGWFDKFDISINYF